MDMAHVAVFAGEYDFSIKSKVHEELCRFYWAPDIVLDMSEVTFIDSTVLSELVSIVKARQEKGFSRIAVVSQKNSIVRRLLDVTGIVALVDVVESYANEDGDSVCAIADAVLWFKNDPRLKVS